MNRKFHVMGDSHTSFFTGCNWITPVYPFVAKSLMPGIYCYRLGAPLAYNAFKYHTESQAREKIEQIIAGLEAKTDVLVLSFGEIDCRAHVLRQAIRQQCKTEDIVDVCTDNYMKLIRYLTGKGFEVLVWNAVYSANYEENNKDLEFPYEGTFLERNQATRLFNTSMEEKLRVMNVKFLNISDQLICPLSQKTRQEYYFDAVHLNNKLFLYTLNHINRMYGYPVFSNHNICIYRLRKARILLVKTVSGVLKMILHSR